MQEVPSVWCGENGARQDWLLVRPERLAHVPDAIGWRPIRERNQ